MHVARATKERDLFLRLLEIGHKKDIGRLLDEALALIIDATGAQQAYIELYQEERAPQWSLSRGCTDERVEEIRAAISRGIVAEAIATGRTIRTGSAVLDERFATNESVRGGQIEAVICAPIGQDQESPLGIVYLQGRRGGGPFSDEDAALVEILSRHITPIVARLLRSESEKRANDPTQPWRSKLGLTGLIGRSPAIARVLEQVALFGHLDVTILLTGPSGTGKTHLARQIHDKSPRSAGPFVELNCAAIPETLIESELFGAHAGAHSTALSKVAGKVSTAEGGTLFLDEIGELSLNAQAKLLQLMQSRSYYPLGSAQPTTSNVRILAASNSDLEAAVTNGKFRADLFYRLNVAQIRMPAISERTEDVPELAAHFVGQYSKQHRVAALPLSPGAELALSMAEWPGHIRQLANVVEAGLIRACAKQANVLERVHLFPDRATEGEDAPMTFQEATHAFQKKLLIETLTATGWNVVEAARRLDLTRSHLYNLIKAHNLTRGPSTRSSRKSESP